MMTMSTKKRKSTTESKMIQPVSFSWSKAILIGVTTHASNKIKVINKSQLTFILSSGYSKHAFLSNLSVINYHSWSFSICSSFFCFAILFTSVFARLLQLSVFYFFSSLFLWKVLDFINLFTLFLKLLRVNCDFSC